MNSVQTTVPAGEFKQKCLRLIDEVNATGIGLIITKRGKPVAQLVPLSPDQRRHRWPTQLATMGSMADDLIAPAAGTDKWQVLRD